MARRAPSGLPRTMRDECADDRVGPRRGGGAEVTTCRGSIVAAGLSSATPDPDARSSLFAGQATRPPSPYATPTRLAPSFAGHTPGRPSCHAWPSSFARHTPNHPLRHTHMSGCSCLQAMRPVVPHAPGQEDDDTTQQQTDAINERSLSIKLGVENTMGKGGRWRRCAFFHFCCLTCSDYDLSPSESSQTVESFVGRTVRSVSS